jgi:hypothetical protein
MSEFMRSDRELDDAVNGSNNFEMLRENMLSTLSNRGLLTRSRTDAFDIRVLNAPVLDAPPPTSGSGFKFEKEVRFAESTGRRTLVIRANSIEDLNALEQQVSR